MDRPSETSERIQTEVGGKTVDQRPQPQVERGLRRKDPSVKVYSLIDPPADVLVVPIPKVNVGPADGCFQYAQVEQGHPQPGHIPEGKGIEPAGLGFNLIVGHPFGIVL